MNVHDSERLAGYISSDSSLPLKLWHIEQIGDWVTELGSEDISAALHRIVTRVIRDESTRRWKFQPA